MDSTAPGFNPGVNIEERVFNPSISDVKDVFKSTPIDNWTALSLDVEAAHKRVKIRPEEHGLLLFRVGGKTFYFKVCHFGGRFSAYWWGRTAALLIRVLHKAIYIEHGGWIFVDDFLWALKSSVAPLMASFVCFLLIAMGCPISWAKAKLGTNITWIGWSLNFRLGTVSATESKVQALMDFLDRFAAGGKKQSRSSIETGVGLAMWLAALIRNIKPWLSVFYKCLNNPSLTLVSVNK